MPGILNRGATPPSNERTLEVDCPQAWEFNDGSESRDRINAASAAGNTRADRVGRVTR